MRVLLANKFLYPKGGAERAVLSLGDALRRRGHAVAWFGMADPRNTISGPDVELVPARDYHATGPRRWRDAAAMLYSLEARRRFAALLDRFRPEVVHVHNIYHQLTPAILDAARRRGTPVVMTVHDYKLVCPRYDMLREGRPCDACVEAGPRACWRYRCAGGSSLGSLLLYAEAVLHRWLKSYDAVRLFLVPSRFLEGTLRRARFDPRRLRHLPNGVAIAPADGAAQAGRCVYAGRLSPEKGVETLVRAASAVRGLELVLCGDGPLREPLAAFAARAPAGRIVFRGHLEPAALQAEIAAASFVAVPSEWYENAPFAVLEAMADGRAVLASNLGGLPELVEDGITGVLLPPGDVARWQAALAAAASSPASMQELGKRAQERVRARFDFETHLEAVESVYREVAT